MCADYSAPAQKLVQVELRYGAHILEHVGRAHPRIACLHGFSLPVLASWSKSSNPIINTPTCILIQYRQTCRFKINLKADHNHSKLYLWSSKLFIFDQVCSWLLEIWILNLTRRLTLHCSLLGTHEMPSQGCFIILGQAYYITGPFGKAKLVWSRYFVNNYI